MSPPQKPIQSKAFSDCTELTKIELPTSITSLEYGIFDYQSDLYQIQKQLVKSSDEVYVLADSSKFEKTGLLKLNNMNPEYIYITDNSLRDEIVKLYRENDIKIHLGEQEK